MINMLQATQLVSGMVQQEFVPFLALLTTMLLPVISS